MLNMNTYHRQHAEIGEVLSALSGKLDTNKLSNGGALEVCADVSRLVGMLSVHLASEDERLYPELAASPDPAVSDAAERFQSEIGGLKTDVEMYFLKWVSPQAVIENPEDFITDSQTVLGAVSDRIDRENDELYPLVENA